MLGIVQFKGTAMIAFFQGWRRKAGVVALVMTCIATSGWIRSWRIRDIVWVPIRTSTHGTIDSNDGSVALGIRQRVDSGERVLRPQWSSIDATALDELLSMYNNTWTWRCGGFGFVDTPWGYGFWVIPYWLIAIPLSAISACLLFGRPRSKSTVKP